VLYVRCLRSIFMFTVIRLHFGWVAWLVATIVYDGHDGKHSCGVHDFG
jgi:hypothetical protein